MYKYAIMMQKYTNIKCEIQEGIFFTENLRIKNEFALLTN